MSWRPPKHMAYLVTIAECVLLLLLCADVTLHYLNTTGTTLSSAMRSATSPSSTPPYLRVVVYMQPTPSVEARSLARLLLRPSDGTTPAVKYQWRHRNFTTFQHDLITFHTTHTIDAFLLVCELLCEPEWEQFVIANSSFSRAHIGLIHLSDEAYGCDYHRVGLYSRFAFVYRNYLRTNLKQHLYYALRSMPPHQLRLQWNRLAHINYAYMLSAVDGRPVDCEAVIANTTAVNGTSGFPLVDSVEAQRLYQHVRSLPQHTLPHIHGLVTECWRRVEQHASSYHAFSTSEPWHQPQPFLLDGLSAQQQQYSASDNVYWFPLGTGNDVVDELVEQNWLPTSERPLLFGWVGHVHPIVKPERNVFLDAFTQSVTVARQSNRSHVLQLLGDQVFIQRAADFHLPLVQLVHYTQLLLDSRYMPAPAGVSPEQYRLWEAMHHHTHPIVLTRHIDSKRGAIQYMTRLGLDPITIREWSELPAVLLQLDLLPPVIVDEWQQVRKARLQCIMTEVGRQLQKLTVATALNPRSRAAAVSIT